MEIPKSMRAVRITRHGGPDVLEMLDVPTPGLQAGEVLVLVRAAALNNTDLWTRAGAYGRRGDPEALSGWRGPVEFPRIQGADVLGRVVAVGSGVDESIIDRRVVVDPAIYDSEAPDANPVGLMGSERDGGYAQFVAVAADRVHDVTDSPLTDDQLATLPTAYGTALGMIERGGLRAGDTALVTGASGGVGLALVHIARARGARVLAVTSGSKLERVGEAGAHVVLDRGKDLAQQISATAPEGIDVVLDVVAGQPMFDLLSLLREGGRWVVAGALGGYDVNLDVRRLYLHNAQIIGSSMHTPRHFDLLIEMARKAEIQPVVAANIPPRRGRSSAAAAGATRTRGQDRSASTGIVTAAHP